MQEEKYNKLIAFQSLSDAEKISLLDSMIDEYKDSPKITKVLNDIRKTIENSTQK